MPPGTRSAHRTFFQALLTRFGYLQISLLASVGNCRVETSISRPGGGYRVSGQNVNLPLTLPELLPTKREKDSFHPDPFSKLMRGGHLWLISPQLHCSWKSTLIIGCWRFLVLMRDKLGFTELSWHFSLWCDTSESKDITLERKSLKC